MKSILQTFSLRLEKLEVFIAEQVSSGVGIELRRNGQAAFGRAFSSLPALVIGDAYNLNS